MSETPDSKRRRLRRNPTLDPRAAKYKIDACQKQQVDRSLFHSGMLLHALSEQHMDTARELCPSLKSSLNGKRTWGSLCSGSEGAHFVMEAIQDSFRKHGFDFELQQVFACEVDPKKREWIDQIINSQRRAEQRELICIFKNIKDMGGSVADCHTHGHKCRVPSCDFLVVSTSCKDMSPLSSSKFANPVLSLNHSAGGSADTFRGLLAYLDNHEVVALFYENSDHLDSDNAAGSSRGDSNRDWFEAELTSRHFEGQSFILNSRLFCLPLCRSRFFRSVPED